ncbi:MAG TPA: hypothetical protein VHI13_14570 [Candidatus Kapabacteria bacterium]|nr:hypothetical protein [Candidatus Kapabacteria bacterium]
MSGRDIHIVLRRGALRLGLACLVLRSLSTAQPMPVPKPVPYPTQSLMGFSFAQATSSNWTQGEADFLTTKFYCRLRRQDSLGFLVARTVGTMDLGATYRDDSVALNRVRVADNEIFGELQILYPLHWLVDPYVATNLRTPVTESFQYLGLTRCRTSSLWNPVTTMQSAGLSFDAGGAFAFFTARAGFALQQIRAHDQWLMTDDPATPEIRELYRARSGIELVAETQLHHDSTLTCNGRFGAFGSFNDLGSWTVHYDNEMRLRVWNYFGLTWTLNVLCDPRQNVHTQFKQSFMIGVVGGI